MATSPNIWAAFNDAEHYELLREADRMESLINQHWTIMGEYDRQHRVNSFATPNVVQPRDEQVTVASGVVSYRFAPASVTRLQISLD